MNAEIWACLKMVGIPEYPKTAISMGKMTDDGQTVDPIFRQTQISAIPPHKWMKIESNGSCAPANSLQNQASNKMMPQYLKM